MGILKNLFANKIMLEASNINELNPEKNSIHQYKVETLEGQSFDFSSLKGKKLIVVNTASKCGLTPQYQKLQELYDTYGKGKLEVVGFPANDFLSQEPGNNEQIGEFCQRNYGVSFPMMSKISVKGKKKHEIYQFLTEKALNGVGDTKVKWNFQKYLIDENGFVIKCISPRTSPLDEEIVDWIKE